jgi:hypothetical protein
MPRPHCSGCSTCQAKPPATDSVSGRSSRADGWMVEGCRDTLILMSNFRQCGVSTPPAARKGEISDQCGVFEGQQVRVSRRSASGESTR